MFTTQNTYRKANLSKSYRKALEGQPGRGRSGVANVGEGLGRSEGERGPRDNRAKKDDHDLSRHGVSLFCLGEDSRGFLLQLEE